MNVVPRESKYIMTPDRMMLETVLLALARITETECISNTNGMDYDFVLGADDMGEIAVDTMKTIEHYLDSIHDLPLEKDTPADIERGL